MRKHVNSHVTRGWNKKTDEVPELFPVPAFPSAEEVSLGLPMVELKRRLDVESRLSG